jgi:hypothetical protein
MVFNIKFIFFGYNKLRENQEFEEIIVFILRINQKAYKEMNLCFIQKNNKIMFTIKD